MENIEKIWILYAKTKDEALKQKLIVHYAPLVKYVAGRLSIHIGQYVEYEDLVGYGIFGLIDAIDKFDLVKGVKFETYATLRIKGSIIDNIRKIDWVPRSLRQKNKLIEDLFSSLEHELGRAPTDEEMADRLKVSVEEIREMIKKSSILTLISLDDYLEQNHEAVFSHTNNENTESPEKKYEKRELKEMLINAINDLNDKEKKVITLYYFEDLTLKEIASILSVSESRISQIHSKAVLRLQSKLGRYKNILFSI